MLRGDADGQPSRRALRGRKRSTRHPKEVGFESYGPRPMTLRIRYVQSGGFAGLMRGCTIDAAGLAPAAATVMKRLVKAATLAKLKTARTQGVADLLLHDFAIETDAGTLQLSFDDLTLPKPLKPLASFLAGRSKPLPPP